MAALAGFLGMAGYAAWQTRFSNEQIRMFAVQPTRVEVDGSDKPRRTFDPSIRPVSPSLPDIPQPPAIRPVARGAASLPGVIPQPTPIAVAAPAGGQTRASSPRALYVAAANAGVRYQVLRKLSGGGFQGGGGSGFDAGDVIRLRLEANQAGWVYAFEARPDGSAAALAPTQRIEAGAAVTTPDIELAQAGRREILICFTRSRPEAATLDAFRAALARTGSAIRAETAEGFVYVVNDAAGPEPAIPVVISLAVR